MSTVSSDATVVSEIQEFKQKFQSNLTGQDVNKLISASVVESNISAVNELLKAFLGAKGETFITEVAPGAKKTAAKSNNKFYKTFNTRTPFIEIWINGIKVWPEFKYGDLASVTGFQTALDRERAATNEQYRATFQDISIESAFGGVVGTLSGSLRLYAREPLKLWEILTLEPMTSTVGSATAGSTELTGMPIVEVRFGWKVESDPGIIEEISFENTISMLVTNIEMSDPGGGQGSDFTLALADLGSTQLTNSAANVYVKPDYPQEQLRYILESLLGIRLFTLDDFMQLSTSGQVAESPSTTFFVSEKNGYLRFNSNTVFNIIDSLLDKIRCRWYSIKNSDLEQEASASVSAGDNIRRFKKQLSEAKEESESKTIIDNIQKEKQKTSRACRLVWISNIPENIFTSSNQYYQQSWERGGYVLLPELAGSDSSAEDIPLIYGPGASAIPYFYGSGINVAQKAMSQAGVSSQTFGDVLAVTSQHSGLLGLMKSVVSEELPYTSVGERLKSTGVVKYSKYELEKLNKTVADAAQKEVEATKKQTEANVKTTRALYRKISKKTISFSGNVSQRILLIGDHYSTKTDPKKSSTVYSTYSNTKSAAIDRLANRINAFLNVPTSISMTVLGDPLLLRQGFGAFELISYYPTEFGDSQILNTFLSGVYVPTKITHRLDLSGYITELQGVKITSSDVPASISAYINKLQEESTKEITAIQQAELAKSGKITTLENKSALAQGLQKNIIQIDLDLNENPFLMPTSGNKQYVSSDQNKKATETTVPQNTIGTLIDNLLQSKLLS